MTTPHDIAQATAAFDAAVAAHGSGGNMRAEYIARCAAAIAAERERCAEVVQDPGMPYAMSAEECYQNAAAAIRAPVAAEGE